MVDHQRDGEAGDDLVSWSAGEGNTRRRGAYNAIG